MVQQIKYTFSFTGGSALIAETVVIAEEYVKHSDWTAVQHSVWNNNLLNKVKEATFKREFSEIKKRLSLLTGEQLQLIVHGSLDDAKAMILLAMVKAYSFLRDFISEVISTKYNLFDNSLSEHDYLKFVNAKRLAHKELDTITDITANKVRQVTFKILEQIGLITRTKNGIIVRPMLSTEVIEAIVNENPSLLVSFLYSLDEIKKLSQKQKHA